MKFRNLILSFALAILLLVSGLSLIFIHDAETKSRIWRDKAVKELRVAQSNKLPEEQRLKAARASLTSMNMALYKYPYDLSLWNTLVIINGRLESFSATDPVLKDKALLIMDAFRQNALYKKRSMIINKGVQAHYNNRTNIR
tara:strand:+ start:181 stop:606 length:426 start_codon:yes stop_codon:yes gene_type:complete